MTKVSQFFQCLIRLHIFGLLFSYCDMTLALAIETFYVDDECTTGSQCASVPLFQYAYFSLQFLYL